MPLWEKDDIFDHRDKILALEARYLLQHRLRGCTLFELELLNELVALRSEIERLKYDAEHPT